MLKVGHRVSAVRTFTAEQVTGFAELSKDFNPVHVDAAYASTTPFGQRIVHGMFVSAMFSSLLAEELPGPGTIYLGQELSFKKPVFLDERITAVVEIVEIPKAGVFKLKTTCTKENGEVAIEGSAVVMNKQVPCEVSAPAGAARKSAA